MHLDSVLDLASRRVVGFALGERHDAQLAYSALAMSPAATVTTPVVTVTASPNISPACPAVMTCSSSAAA